jgi:hypothetical protein
MGNKATTCKRKSVITKNKKHAERTITLLRGAMECKNISAGTDYRFQKYTSLEYNNNNFEGTETNTCSYSLNLLRREYLLQKHTHTLSQFNHSLFVP